MFTMFQSQFLVGLVGLALFANSGVSGARIEVAALNINAQPAPLPSIEVYEIRRENVNSLNYMINDRRSLQLVNTSRNSDLLFGEETAPDSALLLKCHAPYSVQWIFRGDSDPEFNTNTSTTEDHGSYSYNAYLFLGSRRNLNERETGKYICTSVRSKRMQSYVYIFVTRAALFTNKGLETIHYSKNDDSVRVPCSLSEPRAIATLQKSQEGILKCPMNDSVTFDAKQGFLLNLRRIEQPQGTYLCIADYNNTFQIIKYNVVHQIGSNETHPDQTSEEDNEPSTSEPPVGSPSPNNCAQAKLKCGHNAGCVINNKGDAVCRCEEDYVGNPYVECKHISQTTSAPPPPQHPEEGDGSGPTDEFPSEFCSSDKECPYDRACIHNTCQDPCTVKSICGPNTICNDTENHIPSCHCKEGFVGDPYSSQQGQQCEATRCEPNPCGENTNCKHVNDNVISCSCKQGYTRHHDGVCRPSKKGSPVQIIHYPPRARPSSPAGITSGGGPTNKVKECHYDTDCADDRMCVQDKCDDPCVNACGQNAICHTRNHFPRCVCPTGTKGDPFYKCSPLFSEIISASSGSSSSSAYPPPKPPRTNVIPSESDEVVDCGGRNTPCGPNSICQATKRYFVCACPNFFVGDAYSKVGCARENGYHKCRNDADCPHFLACLRFEGCVNPCNVKNVCQRGRSCVPYLHRPACLKTANFDEERPRDDLPGGNLETNEELEITDVPVGLNGTSCFIKSADNKLISPCGRNSFCVDINGQPFCGCTANTVGDPYTGCEPLQSCKNESMCGAKETCEEGFCREKLDEDITVSSKTSNNSSNPCSPSPCADPLEQCIIMRSNNSALCIPSRDNLTAIEMSDLSSSENLLRSGLCLEGNCEDYVDDEADIGSTTELAYFTVVPSTVSYLPSSSSFSSVSVEERRSFRERVEVPTSNESRQLMREELSVVDA